MANTTETKKKPGRPKKVQEAQVETKDTALDEALAMIAQMKGELEALKAEKAQPTQTVVASAPMQSRKIKCVSLSHHPINVFTQPELQGKAFKFSRYGQVIQIKYDELLEVLASYPETMATGLIYICDSDVVEENGLAEAYEKIYDKDTLDKITYMHEPSDGDLIVGMNDELKESVVIEVIKKYQNGEKMDANALASLKEDGIDIIELAKETTVN